jgi:hypothetical protein
MSYPSPGVPGEGEQIRPHIPYSRLSGDASTPINPIERNTAMACWVAPSVAADLLKTSVPDLMERVDRGELEMKEQGGFEFINIGESDVVKADRPSTYTIVTREEQDALIGRDDLVETLDIGRMRLQSAATRKRPMAA